MMVDRPTLPILELALEFLRRDASGEYVWGHAGEEALPLLLDVLFAVPEDASASIDELLRLASVLELELRSPSAAAGLLAALRADPRVTAGCDRSARSRAKSAHWSGSQEIRRAPMRREERRARVTPADGRKRRAFRTAGPG